MRPLLALVVLAFVGCSSAPPTVIVNVEPAPDGDGGSVRATQLAPVADDAGAPDPDAAPSPVDPSDAGADASSAPVSAPDDAGHAAPSDASPVDSDAAPDVEASVAPCVDLTQAPYNCVKLGPQSWCPGTKSVAMFCGTGNKLDCTPAGNGDLCCPTGPRPYYCP